MIPNTQLDISEFVELIKQKNLDSITNSINSGFDVNIHDGNGISVLFQAIQFGNLGIVKILVEKGANVNYKNNQGITSLMIAASVNSMEIVKFLIDAKANITDIDVKGKKAIDYAAERNLKGIVDYLKETIDEKKPTGSYLLNVSNAIVIDLFPKIKVWTSIAFDALKTVIIFLVKFSVLSFQYIMRWTKRFYIFAKSKIINCFVALKNYSSLKNIKILYFSFCGCVIIIFFILHWGGSKKIPLGWDTSENVMKRAENGESAAQYELGKRYWAGNAEFEAYVAFKQASNAGYAPAQYALGEMYYKGVGWTHYKKGSIVPVTKATVEQDRGKAKELFEEAAMQGFPDALNRLGSLHDDSDPIKAYAYYNIARICGHDKAMENRDAIFKKMTPEQIDKAEELSQELFKKLEQDNAKKPIQPFQIILITKIKNREQAEKDAMQGDAKAQFYLGTTYYQDKDIPKDYKKAIEWYEKAALQGDVKAQFILSSMYYNGKGVPKDSKKAFEWCEKAATQGDAKAQYGLGIMYDNGEGIPKDSKKAIEWYEKAALQGDAEAQFDLGLKYYNGAGITKDFKKAFEWYEKAALQDVAKAKFGLGLMYYKGQNVSTDYNKSFEWFEKAALQGDVEAQRSLGGMYFLGEGVSKDNIKAYAFINIAFYKGDVASKEMRDVLQKGMTSDQISKAEELSRKLVGTIEVNKKKIEEDKKKQKDEK